MLTVIFITVNYFVIDDFLSETEKLLEMLPAEIENESDKALAQRILYQTDEKWDKMETYISICLEHKMRREFIQEFTRTKRYFESEMYDEYSSSIELLSKMIEYIKFNEGVSFGNIM